MTDVRTAETSMAALSPSASASASASSPPSFARPLPSAQPREHFLWRYFARLRQADADSGQNLLAHLALQRSDTWGRWLGTEKEYKQGAAS
jgi:hypothetical protein